MADPPQSVARAERVLGVIVPAYNEERSIEQVIRRVLQESCVQQVVVVDDCSTDGTLAAARRFASDPKVAIKHHEANRGKGAAIRTGLDAISAPLVIIQDADLEYDPADYPALLRPIEMGRADVVYGSRFRGSAENRVQNFWHTVGNRALTLISNVVTDLNLTDMATCYKAFHRRVVPALDLQESGFGVDAEITVKVARAGFRIFEVPVSYFARSRAEGKKIRLRDGISALAALLKYRLARKPAVL